MKNVTRARSIPSATKRRRYKEKQTREGLLSLDPIPPLLAGRLSFPPGVECLDDWQTTIHAEDESEIVQDLLDLPERLAAEVPDLEESYLTTLHQVADEDDVGILEAVGSAD